MNKIFDRIHLGKIKKIKKFSHSRGEKNDEFSQGPVGFASNVDWGSRQVVAKMNNLWIIGMKKWMRLCKKKE